MFGLVLNALRARRAQTVALFVLTVLAGLGASAAPWFAGWARDAVTTANIVGAPAEQRVVGAQGAVRYSPGGPDPLAALRERVGQHLDVPGGTVVVGARLYTTMYAGTEAAAGLYLNYRDDVCAQLTIVGACPSADDEVLLGRATAEALGLKVGDRVRFEAFRLSTPMVLRISGLYDVSDVLSPYWAGTDLLTGPAALLGSVVDDPAFMTRSGLLAGRPDGLDLDFHLGLPDAVFDDPALGPMLSRASGELRQANFEVKTGAPELLDQIARDRRLVALGVGVAATQLVLLCWFALFLAVRYTADERREDIGLLKLRGAAPWRIWAMSAQQSALPMLAGALVGWVAGYLAAAALARSWVGPDGLLLSLGAAAIACLGALLAAVAAEWRLLGAPVVSLLRRVPGGHRGWRADVVDLLVILLAVAGVYQGHAELGGDPSVLSLLAPGLVGLAIALLVARALPPLSTVVGRAALRAGRPGPALAALHLARRPVTNRMFAMLAVAVSVFGTVILYWHGATGSWSQRAAQELGAPVVLTVRASGSQQLLAAVRAADPAGKYAMAVARTNGVRTEDRVVAVDSSRLAAVAVLPDAAGIAALIRPSAVVDPMLVDGAVTLDAGGPSGVEADETVQVLVHLSTVDGKPASLVFGPLTAGRGQYQAQLKGCGTGCRLVSLELLAPRLVNAGRPAAIDLYGLTGASFTDVAGWRGPLGPIGIGTVMAAHEGRLTLTLYSGPRPPGQRIDPRLLVNGAPSPLPVALAGPRAEQRRAGDDRLSVLGGTRVPYRVAAEVPVLPRVGGAGAMVDLEYAQRSNDAPGETAALEVWLTADAPAAVVDGLKERGIVVLKEETVQGRAAQLAQHGPGVALRFQLFAAAILLLLAVGMVVVSSTVERSARGEELRALRAQGLPGPAARIAGLVGGAVLVGLAAITGVVAALVADGLVTASLPVFSDGWHLLAPPSGVAVPLGVGLVISLALLGVAAYLSNEGLGRDRSHEGTDR